MGDFNPRDPFAIGKAASSRVAARHPRTGKRLQNGKWKTGEAVLKEIQKRWRMGRPTRDISLFPGVERNPSPKGDYVRDGRELVDRLGPNRVPKGLVFQVPGGELLKGGRRLPPGLKVQATRSGQIRVVRDGSVPVKVIRSAFKDPKGRFAEATRFRVKDEERFKLAVQKEADAWVPGGEASSRQVQILLDAAKEDLL